LPARAGVAKFTERNSKTQDNVERSAARLDDEEGPGALV
jgi:hypothetical protein